MKMINEKDAPIGYVAIAPLRGRGSCFGGVFDTPNTGCDLAMFGGDVGQCTSRFREDKQNVIFRRENK
jgi:hypothetical protein